MNREEQCQFVRDLTKTIANSLVNDIQTGKVPETWTGIELRHLIADRFRERGVIGQMTVKARREYLSAVVNNGL